MILSHFFQLTPISPSALVGTYSWPLIMLSYFIAFLASFVALDITERIRTGEEDVGSKIGWLILGAFAMGMGIWSMHFIGMLAVIFPMPMDYQPELTGLSLLVAIIASAFAFFLIKNEKTRLIPLVLGGILLGLGIVSMHYIGMAAMLHVHIRYIPSIFFLSILIAIIASETALWFMIRGSKTNDSYHTLLKMGSALIMGLGICGMHYTGMAAAVIVEDTHVSSHTMETAALNIKAFSFYIATTTILIMGIALATSRFRMNVFQAKNKKLIETEKILELKSLELQKLNENLIDLVESSIDKEEKIRAILTAAADGILVINERGMIEICNRAASGILGYPENEIISENITKYIGIFDQPISFSSLISKQNILLEMTGFLKGNKIIPLELTISKSSIKDNMIYIIVFRDITERKRAEHTLASLNSQLVSTARLAGMVEVATGVLHNVGNVLNSINVSTQILLERDNRSKLSGLIELVKVLKNYKNNLDVFVKTHPIGELLPQYLEDLSYYLQNDYTFFHHELESLNTKVQHIKSIIAMQQSLSGNSHVIEKIQLNTLLNEALMINFEMIEKYEINVEKDFGDIPPFDTDKVKIMQTLINLIKNAIESLVESTQKEKKIVIRTTMADPHHIQIEVIDNGIGIKIENITEIFSYGFTTKTTGHGFGLHTSALSIQEMGGSLKAYSPGPNKGATFIILLPKQIKDTKDEH